jgi:hypothetical protein
MDLVEAIAKPIYIKREFLTVCLYVDDMILIGNLLVNEFKTTMKHEFEMIDLDLMK